MNMRQSLLAFLIFCIALPSTLSAQNALTAEADKLLSLENSLVKGSVGTTALMKSTTNLDILPDTVSWNLDFSFGGIASPSYALRTSTADFTLFKNLDMIGTGRGESAQALHCSVAVGLPFGVLAVLNASYLPGFIAMSSNKSNLRLGGTLLYRLLEARMGSTVGVDIGAGYSWMTGHNETILPKTDWNDSGPTAALDRYLLSRWLYNVLYGSVSLKKYLGLLYFYGNIGGYGGMGNVSSEIRAGNTSATFLVKTDASPGFGLVTSGGMELFLGWFLLNAEAGYDWMTGSLYGNAGVRFGV